MNIFWLDKDVHLCVKYHCDKHVVKMILEYAQLMCTAHHVLDGSLAPTPLYKSTHVNHPCAVWVRQSSANYMRLYDLFIALCEEYTYRYGKEHLTYTKLRVPLSLPPVNTPQIALTQPPQCMPEEFHRKNVVEGYRNYYNESKYRMARWTNREVPPWFNSE